MAYNDRPTNWKPGGPGGGYTNWKPQVSPNPRPGAGFIPGMNNGRPGFATSRGSTASANPAASSAIQRVAQAIAGTPNGRPTNALPSVPAPGGGAPEVYNPIARSPLPPPTAGPMPINPIAPAPAPLPMPVPINPIAPMPGGGSPEVYNPIAPAPSPLPMPTPPPMPINPIAPAPSPDGGGYTNWKPGPGNLGGYHLGPRFPYG